MWEKVSFQDKKFLGKATFDITKELTGKVNPEILYSKQKLRFEFG